MKIITAMVEGGKVTGIYLKPDNTLNRKRLPFFVPEEPAEVAARVGVAVTIEKVGKTIRREFAERYYEKAALAVEVTDMAAEVLHSFGRSGVGIPVQVQTARACNTLSTSAVGSVVVAFIIA